MAKILLNGKFDVLTVGHFNLLNHARRYAGLDGEVIVAIDSDKRISASNPKLPIFDQDTRIANLRLIKCLDRQMVNHVVMFDTDEDLRLIIKLVKPDHMVKGTDWANKPIVGGELITNMIWYPVDKISEAEKISSTNIIQAILDKHENKNDHQSHQ